VDEASLQRTVNERPYAFCPEAGLMQRARDRVIEGDGLVSDEEQTWERAEARNRELGREKQRVRGPKFFAVAEQDENGEWVVVEREDKSEAGWIKSIVSSVLQAPWSR
jgi:hypothetical protein